MEAREELEKLLQDSITKELYQIVLSNPRDKDGVSRRKARPILVKEKLLFQVTSFEGAKAFHDNMEAEELKAYILREMEQNFKQAQITCLAYSATVLVSKKGRCTIQKKAAGQDGAKAPDLSHNRSKRYILPEGEAIPFLVDLGVQTKDGQIVRAKYDKYRQMNRYLEFVEDILPILPRERTVTILDFGCGKSYLTFALYYYLKILRKYDIHVIGLDLKEDVIAHCSALAKKYGYEGLEFLKGDIAAYEGCDSVDMVVSLHACDTATDFALQKAVRWNAGVIFAVPCCQHEVNRQLHSELLEPLLQYGLLRERIAALVTDGVRANLLEQMGYDTQLVEFIDMEHTPKNILIRAVKRDAAASGRQDGAKLDRLMQELHIHPTLEALFNKE